MGDSTNPRLPFLKTSALVEASSSLGPDALVPPSGAIDVDACPSIDTGSPCVWTLDGAEPAFALLGERIEAITGQRTDLTIRPDSALPTDLKAPIPLPPRYSWLGPLGEGGQGSVELVEDHDLGRQLALKTLLPHKRSGEHLLDLYREARITGQLDHPQIIRIYDVGQLPDGRLYYTMPRMPGASLHDVLVLLRRHDPDTEERWDLPALVSALEKACAGVGYAHAHGVIHRDLKPANILLGDHGEVLVVDWGIAHLVETKSDEDTQRALLWSQTGEVRKERVRGSPPYMAPEQIQHPNQVTSAADVFCLGVILYEALTGVSPFPGKDVETIVRGVCHVRPIPPRERSPNRTIPAELEEICLRALEKFPGHRFTDASELASALRGYLSGARRQDRANRRVKEARAMHERLQGLATRRDAARQNLEAANLPRVSRHESGTEMRALIEQDNSVRRAADGVLTEALRSLQEGLSDAPRNPDVLELLGEFYAERYAEAERGGPANHRPLYRALIGAFDGGKWQAWMNAGCEVSVDTLPISSQLELLRLEERAGELRISESLGLLAERTCTALAPGRYALAPAIEGAETESLSIPRRWIYPLLLRRGERLSLRIDLRGESEAGEAFAFVPGGPALLGGDPEASGSGGLRALSLPPFSIAKDPVTVGAYDRFLAALRGDSLALARRRRPDGFDQQLRTGLDRPVVGMSQEDARAYAAWLATMTGRVIRLPKADEWEKSVRAADGRTYPWGNGWRRSYCASVLTCQPCEAPPAADDFPNDCSPFGVRGGAGGVWEWTGDSEKNEALVVGGSIVSEAGGCRVAGRRELDPDSKLPFLGFRVLMEPSR